MMRVLLLGGIGWTDRHQGIVLAGAVLCCHLALWIVAP